MQRTRRRIGRPAPTVIRRWAAVGVLAFVAFLYYQPLRTYFETRGALAGRAADVQALQVDRKRLERRLAIQTSPSALTREARRLGYVKPGERLFIVKGVRAWRKAHQPEAQ